jgi:hypothetical protein
MGASALDFEEVHMEGETRQVSAQLRTSSFKASKVIKDRESVKAVVDVSGRGTLTLSVDSGGGYSLRARPEGEATPSRDLLAVGVLRADGVVSILPRT